MTESILTLDTLLSPIAGDNPAGVDGREDAKASEHYYEIREARDVARSIEKNLLTKPNDESQLEAKVAAWEKVMKKSTLFLETISKDIEVAGWLTESLVRLYGFEGLSQGFLLIKGLILNFWDNLYPLPDEEGLAIRLAIFSGLNGVGSNQGTLVSAINMIPLVKGTLYSSWLYSQAQELDKTTDKQAYQKKVAAGIVPTETIRAAVKKEDIAFYQAEKQALTEIEQAIADIEALLTMRCSAEEMPGFNKISKALSSASSAFNQLMKPILGVTEENETQSVGQIFSTDTLSSNTENSALMNSVEGNISHRQDAFLRLKEIAQFFKETEPHSPIGYSIERLVRWGEMSLPELLAELMPDEHARDLYGNLVGLPKPQVPQYPGQNYSPMPQEYGNMPAQQNMMGGGMHQQPMQSYPQYGDQGMPSTPTGYEEPIFR
jgi:type VI secretion system protein ImpA